MDGYHGQYLRVDLSGRRAELVPLPADVLRRFIGGAGLGVWLLDRETPPGYDPLGPEAALVLALSPLVGTPLTTSAKFAVVAKSPLTGRLNDALSSSHFALAAKRAGLDALVIRGSCSEPSVLVIEDGPAARIIPAPELWGLSADAAADRLRDQLGSDVHVAAIGVAGEHQVRFATISADGRHAGRGGSGAVLGAKNLKAVALRGGRRTAPLADPAGVVARARDLSARSLGPATEKYRELGTVANLLVFNRLGALPARNFQANTFAGAEALAGEELTAVRRMARRSCAACTIGCEHIFAVRGPAGPAGGGVRLEYESLFALGPLCGIHDPDVVLQAAQRCDQWGLDTISAGATIAFAMECAERGLLDAPGLRFGAGPALLQTLDRIATRTGLGDLLAEGTRRAAAVIGGPAPDFAPHVKGLEIPGYEPRALQTMALGFAVSSRGADHNRSGAYEVDFSDRVDRLNPGPEAARMAIETEDRAALIDSLILCKFLRGVFADFFTEAAELLRLVTGAGFTADELRTTARRIVTAKKLFNLREGWTAAEDTLPRRFLQEGLADGVSAGAALPRQRLEAMVGAYYAARGWDADGTVSGRLRAALGLRDDEFLPGSLK